MLKPGDSYHYLTDAAIGETTKDGRVRYANNPLNAANTRLIADALTSGFRLVEPGGFRDTVEQTDKGPLRKVEWYIDGKSRGIFVTAEGREEIDFQEFRRRYQSEEWCLEHQHHPISKMVVGHRLYADLMEQIKAQPAYAENRSLFAEALKSSNTRLVSDALAVGFRLAENALYFTHEKIEWAITPNSEGVFLTREKQGEAINFQEFQRRHKSEEWCLEHCHHVIAFFRWRARHLGLLRDQIRALTPAAVLRRGKRSVTIPANLPQDKKEKLLNYLK